jgi:hypothetical protein
VKPSSDVQSRTSGHLRRLRSLTTHNSEISNGKGLGRVSLLFLTGAAGGTVAADATEQKYGCSEQLSNCVHGPEWAHRLAFRYGRSSVMSVKVLRGIFREIRTVISLSRACTLSRFASRGIGEGRIFARCKQSLVSRNKGQLVNLRGGCEKPISGITMGKGKRAACKCDVVCQWSDSLW